MNTAELAKKLSIRQQPFEKDDAFASRVAYWYEVWKRKNLIEDD